MKLTMDGCFGAVGSMGLKLGLGLWLLWMALGGNAGAQALSTTTVQGTVYLANGMPGAGTLNVSWPAFTTASGQSVTAGHLMVTIAPDGFLSVKLAPNVGATPAGLYYTVVYQMSDGTTSTQYWVVPAAAQASVGQVQAQLMPAAQAVQTVSKAYVDQSIAELTGSLLTASGGTLSGPLYLNGDPTQPLQASDKHYVDASITSLNAASLGAGTTQFAGEVTGLQLGAAYQVDQFPGADFGAKLQACINGASAVYGGTCDARNFSGTLQMGSGLTVSTGNVTVLLPCATIATANQLIVTAGTRNVALRGCTLRGASTASGSQGGTVFLYSGAGAMVQVGDPTYAVDTLGFHMDNAVINTTPAMNSTAQALIAYRTQEMDIESLYLLGNSNQTGMTLDGTGNYTGGSFVDDEFSGFQTAVNAIGHQVTNAATTDWMNASMFSRLHIDCPTSGGSPISGTYGINLLQGDGNTFTGGDVEGCATALHLGSNAQNNTIIGLRNENSTNQVVADAGSSYNNWITGGTMFTGQLTDNGTRNSFLDTFHRSFNGMHGDWYGSQQDATVTNHFRVGIGAGNERGLLNRYQTDSGYRWTTGLSDATAGEQFYEVLDELNNVNRLSIGQYNQGQASTNNQTVVNAAGTGAVVLNGSNNAGTGGVVIGSGGASEATVATISNAGNAQFNGTLQVGGASTFVSTPTVKNQVDTEIDAILWAGLTQSQKESLVYKDWNGNSQWYAEKDANNNWELNSAIGGLDSFKAYQSTNSGDTYVNASNASGVVRVNYETGAGAGFKVYGGNSSSLYASFTGPSSIEFPGLAASGGHNCLQIDNSGYITNTGSACGTGSSGVTGTINSGNAGQIAYYTASGAAIGGMTAVPVTAGGTGAVTSAAGLASLGGVSLNPSGNAAQTIAGPVGVSNFTSMGPRYDVTNPQFGATGNGVTDDTAAIQAAFNACWNHGVPPYGGVVEFPGAKTYIISSTINAYDGCRIEGVDNSYIGIAGPPQIRWQNGATQGTAYSITSFTAAANTSPFFYAASSPTPNYQPYIVTFTSANALAANQWVLVQGCSTAKGLQLNNVVAQVASASSSSFTVVVPFTPTYLGTYSDSCTATTVNTAIAFDANSRYEEDVNNINLSNVNGVASNQALGVDLYFGSRVDTGTRITNSWIDNGLYFNYYFAAGGIDVELDKGWRSDGNATIANLYWRVSGVDNFGMANGTISATTGNSGAYVMLDDQSCLPNSGVHFSSRNMRMEVDTPIASGLGVFTMLDCPSGIVGPEFFLDMENTYTVAQNPSTVGFNFPSFVMSPANDTKLSLNVVNGSFPAGIGSNTTVPFIGLPALSRSNLTGSQGVYPALTYASSTKSTGGAGNYGAFAGLSQFMGDVNIGQLWQDGIQASDFLYSDTAYSALPNGTSLYAGQVIAPPAYWNSGSSTNGRYALDVVQQAGTTGIPNGGNTTCETTATAQQFACTSAIDLSPGDRISVGSATNRMIQSVDATNPAAVLVNVSSAVGSILTPTVLTFSSPVLGPEMQLPTKSSGSPSTLTWSQGDLAQNSGATANGVAAWVNTGAGTPGTWAAVPSGNSNGQLSLAQVTNGTQSTATVCPNGVGGALTTSGCTSGTVNWANAGQVAYYTGNGTSIGGMNAIPVTAGGTGAATASGALASLGAQAAVPGLASDGASGVAVSGNGTFGGTVAAGTTVIAPSMTDSGLTSGDCIQAGTGGQLTSASGPCSSGGGAWGNITGTLSSQTDLSSALSAKAPLASPALTGTPTAPTQTAGDSSAAITTDAFVASAIAAVTSKIAVPYPGYNMLVTFPPTESGSVGIDLTGNGNNCTFGSPAPTRLATGGIQQNTGANTSAYVCTFPASTTLTDSTITNDRSFVWCGLLIPTTTLNYPNIGSTILGSSDRNGLGTLWLAGAFNSRNNYLLGVWDGTDGVVTATTQLVGAGYTCVGYTLGNHAVDASENHMYQMVNGQAQEVQYTTDNGTNWARRAIGDFYTLGNSSFQSGSFLSGNTEVVAGYAAYLTPSQIEQTMNAFQSAYLVGRGAYGVPSQNTSFVNQAVFDGDSEISPTGSTYNSTPPESQASFTSGLNATWNVTNSAIAGTTLVTHVNDFVFNNAPHASRNAQFSVFSAEPGINDLNLGGQTAAQIIGWNVQLLRAAASAGYNYIILKTHYSSTSSVDDTAVETINSWKRSQAANFSGGGSTVIVEDVANEPCLGAAGAYANPGGLGCNFGNTGASVAITNCQQTGTTVTLTTATQTTPFATGGGDSVSPVLMTGACAVINSTTTSYTTTSATSTSVTFTRSTSATIASTPTSGTLETVFQDGLHLFNGANSEVGRMDANILNYITGSTLAYPTVVSANTTLVAANKVVSVTGASAITITLDKCYGYSLSTPFQINNNSTASVTVQAPSGFTLLGGSQTIAAGGRAKFAANIVSDTASGCQWLPI